MFIHLVSLTKGAMRMVVVSQLDQGCEMRGLITTLNKQGRYFVPVSSPIAYLKRSDFKTATLGEVPAGHAAYEDYKRILDETIAEGYARLAAP